MFDIYETYSKRNNRYRMNYLLWRLMMKKLDMTEGNIMSLLLRFAIPLMLGDLFQQLYIAVDSAMIGNFAGAIPLAAVGSTTFLIRLVIGLFIGMSVGASVVVAQAVGAKNYEKVSGVIHTIISLAFVGGIFLSIFAVFITPYLLDLVSTPAEVMPAAVIYLSIYFAGALFNLIFNVCSSIMQAFGDSKRPFIYLVISSIINIILDYTFIKWFGMGIAGAALATIISQLISMILILINMSATKEEYHISLRKLHIQACYIKEILQMGVPTGLQSAIVGLSNVIMQESINEARKAAMAGFGVFNKVDGIIMLPLASVALACTTFSGQNYGAGNRRRVRRGISSIIVLEMIGWILGSLVCVLGGKAIFGLFTNDAEIIKYAVMTMNYMIPLYWCMEIGYALTCIFRGMGKSHQASILFIFNMCIVRVGFLWVMNHLSTVDLCANVLKAYQFSWIMTFIGSVLYALYLNYKGEFSNIEEV